MLYCVTHSISGRAIKKIRVYLFPGLNVPSFLAKVFGLLMQRSLLRQQLRATFDECVHDAMVPYPLLPLFTSRSGASSLGSDIPRRGRDFAQNCFDHLGGIIRVGANIEISVEYVDQ